MSVVLHIGVEKTGTTTLQRFLYENRQLLRMQGIAFTQSCGPENNRDLATYAIDDAYFNEDHLIQLGIRDVSAKQHFKEAVAARFGAEIAALRNACDNVVISSEHFQSRLKSPAEIQTLADLLAATGLHVRRVVVYLRRPAEIINSMYSTALRNGSTAPRPQLPTNEHWNHICDHRKTIQNWARTFGESVIVPRIFGRTTLAGGSIVDDFCAVAGIDLHGLRVPPNENTSLTASGQALLRYLNHHFPAGAGGQADARRRDIIRFVDRHFSGPAPAPPAQLAAACEERFADSNEWVRARYFPFWPVLFAGESRRDEPKAGIRAVMDTINESWDANWSLLDELRRVDPALFQWVGPALAARERSAGVPPQAASVPAQKSGPANASAPRRPQLPAPFGGGRGRAGSAPPASVELSRTTRPDRIHTLPRAKVTEMSVSLPMDDPKLPGWHAAKVDGVWRRPLVRHDDSRGSFSELWRASWTDGALGTPGSRMCQANLSRSQPRVLRGLHAHLRQSDLWVVAGGEALVALVDLRPALAAHGRPEVEMVDAQPGDMLFIPEGVAHGFYARSRLTLIYFVTNEYDASDELGFAWNDPDAALPWPDREPILSPRDAAAPSLRELVARLRRDQESRGR